ncbi:hypothetical protein AAFF_G00058660 [Aldrovandia affinis]|uniref:Uncharacterized protein n=1 Tax=Aldrovandia affinis TaxID=143900 RepID=A0AAD7S0E4_9TELE|nr:hypothetical protein AAFF_G00058660 [Aldrovandia affinis]
MFLQSRRFARNVLFKHGPFCGEPAPKRPVFDETPVGLREGSHVNGFSRQGKEGRKDGGKPANDINISYSAIIPVFDEGHKYFSFF